MDASAAAAESDPSRPEARAEAGRREHAAAQLAEQIAERLRAEEALRRYASRLEHLQRISLAILSADSLATVVQIAVGYVEETIACMAAVSYTHLDVYKRQPMTSAPTASGQPRK